MLAFERFRFLSIPLIAGALLLVGPGSAQATGSAYVLNAADTAYTEQQVGSTVTIVAQRDPEVISRQHLTALFADPTVTSIVIDTGGGASPGNGEIYLSTNLAIPTGKTLVLDAFTGVTVENATITGDGTLNSSPQTSTTLAQSTFSAGLDIGGATLLTGANTIGGVAVFGGSVNGAQTLTSTTSAAVTFWGAVGSSTPLASLDLHGTTRISNDVRTTGDQTYGDAVTLVGGTMLQSTTGGVTLNAPLDGAHTFRIESFGVTSINAPIGDTSAIDGISFGGLGPIQLGANVRAYGGQVWSKPITLTSNVTIDGSNAPIEFAIGAPIDGAHALTVQSTDAIGFRSLIGATNPLTSLTTGGIGGHTSFTYTDMLPARDVQTITTTGAQSFGHAVLSNPDLAFTGTNVTFAATLTGQMGNNDLQVNASGLTTFGGNVTAFRDVATDAPGTVSLGAALVGVARSITFTDDVTLSTNATLNGNGAIRFEGTVDGAYSLSPTSYGSDVTYGDSVGATTPLTMVNSAGSVTNVAGPLFSVASNYNTSTRTQLTGDVTFRSSGGLSFNQPIDGPHHLTLDATSIGVIAPIGSVTPLASITTTATSPLTANTSTIRTSGAQVYGSALLASRPTLTLSSTTSKVDVAFLTFGALAVSITVDAQAASTLGSVGSMSADAVLSLVGTGDVTASGAASLPRVSVRRGRFFANAFGMSPGDVTVSDTGVLTGRVYVGSITTDGGTIDLDSSFGLVMPNVHGDMTLDPNATFISDFVGGMPEPFIVDGDLALDDATLELGGAASFSAPNVEHFLIRQSGPSPVVGTFDGLAEGDIIVFHGEHLQISYIGGDGNDVTLTRRMYATTSDLESSDVTGWDGNQVTLTATVDGTGAGTPTGTVTFFDDATQIGTATLVGGVATLRSPKLGVGTHRMTARYEFGVVYQSSLSSAVDVEIAPTTPTTPDAQPPSDPVVEQPKPVPPAPKPVAFDVVRPFASASCLRPNSTKLQFAFTTTTATSVTFSLQRRTSGINNVLTRCPKGTSGGISSAKSFVTTRSVAKRYAKPGRYAITLKALLGKRPLIPGRYRVVMRAVHPTTKQVDITTFAFVVLAPAKG